MAEKKNYDSEFCGSLPIHHINLIQDYGYLLVLDKKTFNIIQLSENFTALYNTKVADFVDKPVMEFLSGAAIEALNQLLDNEIKSKVPISVSILVNNKLTTHWPWHMPRMITLFWR